MRMVANAFMLIIAMAFFLTHWLCDQVILVAEDKWLVGPLRFELPVGLCYFNVLSRRHILQFFRQLAHHLHH